MVGIRGSAKPLWFIEAYLGYGTAARLVVSGRVLEDKGVIRSARLDSKWRNLLNTFRRFATGEVAGTRVVARYAAAEAVGITDREGYFRIEIEPGALDTTRVWHRVHLDLVHDDVQKGAEPAESRVLVPPPNARFGVISDIDDTVVQTNVTSTWKMLATVLLTNAHARMPFLGIAPFYRALKEGAAGGENNPIFYVSNGPWNFFGLLVEFLKVNSIPLGPIFLRDFGPHILFAADKAHGGHKLVAIEQILGSYPHLPFILIGDSGERDPEIYAEVVARHAGRIRAIYIRSVDERSQRLAAIAALAERVQATTTQFVLASDSAFAAAHAAGEGLIASSALSGIAKDARL
jgi:phosphatidate phosphatase APP1